MRAKNFLAPRQLAVGIFVLLIATGLVAQTDQAEGSIDPPSVTSTTIPSTMFGMSAHDGVLFGTAWPTMTTTGMRLWNRASHGDSSTRQRASTTGPRWIAG